MPKAKKNTPFPGDGWIAFQLECLHSSSQSLDKIADAMEVLGNDKPAQIIRDHIAETRSFIEAVAVAYDIPFTKVFRT